MDNKIKKGMYIRLKNNIPCIRKIDYIVESIDDGDELVLDKGFINNDDTVYSIYDNEINKYVEKCSYNIKDLMKVGDLISYEYDSILGITSIIDSKLSQNLYEMLTKYDMYVITGIITKEEANEIRYKTA